MPKVLGSTGPTGSLEDFELGLRGRNSLRSGFRGLGKPATPGHSSRAGAPPPRWPSASLPWQPERCPLLSGRGSAPHLLPAAHPP